MVAVAARTQSPSPKTSVYLEVGTKRVFASSAAWPGWCRGGKTEQAALESLALYAPRYAPVAKLAGVDLPAGAADFEVVERVAGNATTDFGAPGVPTRLEALPMGAHEARRMCFLVEACWKHLDQVRATAPAVLRKGPRGGGRDRDQMFEHVLGAEVMYARAIGIRLEQPAVGDPVAVRGFHQAILASLGNPNRKEKWPVAYCARRIAWHALDHAWEMEDRIT
jgi:hypothetical protein